jgi:hypothetical protein
MGISLFTTQNKPNDINMYETLKQIVKNFGKQRTGHAVTVTYLITVIWQIIQ